MSVFVGCRSLTNNPLFYNQHIVGSWSKMRRTTYKHPKILYNILYIHYICRSSVTPDRRSQKQHHSRYCQQKIVYDMMPHPTLYNTDSPPQFGGVEHVCRASGFLHYILAWVGRRRRPRHHREGRRHSAARSAHSAPPTRSLQLAQK